MTGTVWIVLAASIWHSDLQAGEAFGPEGYIDLAGLWEAPFRIDVCWEAGSNAYPSEKKWVQDSARTLIEGNSDIRFVGWGDCRPTALGIRIRVADEWPRSDVGRQWVRDKKNPTRILQDQNTGRPLELPTRTVLNFAFSKEFTSCQNDREHCIRAIGVHELLHAVGFLHEQLRPDAPEDCKKQYASMADFIGISPIEATQFYDSDSHMNYCANMYRKPIRLSAGDIEVLKKFYSSQ